MKKVSNKAVTVGLTALALGLLAGYLYTRRKRHPQQVVDHVEIPAMMGSWYELARLPNPFQKDDWVGSIETYSLNPDSTIAVHYTYHVERFDTPEKAIDAVMWRRSQDAPSGRFKYRPFWPIAANYLVIDLGPDYEYLVVGTSDQSMLWIMSRLPELPEATYSAILKRVTAQGYDISRLLRIPQPDGAPRFES